MSTWNVFVMDTKTRRACRCGYHCLFRWWEFLSHSYTETQPDDACASIVYFCTVAVSPVEHNLTTLLPKVPNIFQGYMIHLVGFNEVKDGLSRRSRHPWPQSCSTRGGNAQTPHKRNVSTPHQRIEHITVSTKLDGYWKLTTPLKGSALAAIILGAAKARPVPHQEFEFLHPTRYPAWHERGNLYQEQDDTNFNETHVKFSVC